MWISALYPILEGYLSMDTVEKVWETLCGVCAKELYKTTVF